MTDLTPSQAERDQIETYDPVPTCARASTRRLGGRSIVEGWVGPGAHGLLVVGAITSILSPAAVGALVPTIGLVTVLVLVAAATLAVRA
ncbi:hypothetical protein GCM10022199_03520 [Marihabitans asiaticum]|uniref:Uncharacterized protein n=1 Tax=Marihabitans asiaticum TaxID=415218 RepID=A0A560WEN4_9MICO|nr:hypothetical protein [Marihabitans asiaticum]TWD15974.1 hypothetical protein FB557_1514 [Marihabitans asiaticum]